MKGAAPRERLWIVGPGRVGLALGLLLQRAGRLAALQVAGRHPAPPAHPLFAASSAAAPPARYVTGLRFRPTPPPTGVLLAVPDDALPQVARALAAHPPPPGTPVLHLAGALGPEVLAPLADAGCSTGALHPLAAVADAVAGAERLRGAWWGVEADGAAQALAARIVEAAGGRLLPLAAGGKPLYHAAAVLAANDLVALLAVAERVMRRAGAPEAEARAALAGLAAGALENVAARGPAAALTGPVARGDAQTVALHLSRLSGAERAVYSLLGREALALARQAGLGAEAAHRVGELLGEEDA